MLDTFRYRPHNRQRQGGRALSRLAVYKLGFASVRKRAAICSFRTPYIGSAQGKHRMAIASGTQAKHGAAKAAKLLAAEYPEATSALEFSNPLDLLIATILS